MSRLRGPAASLLAGPVLAGVLLWGCGNATAPEAATGSVTGQVLNKGPISIVRFRQIIAGDSPSATNSTVNGVVNSDGTFSIPQAPQGPVTLEFADARQVPFAYAELVVQPNTNNVLPQPVMGPGNVPSPDPSVNGTAAALQAGYTGPISATAPGAIAIRAFGPNGQPLATPARVSVYNVNIQGSPTGSVGQNPSATNPGLVAANQAGVESARARISGRQAGDSGGSTGTGTTSSTGNPAGTGTTAGNSTDTSTVGTTGTTGTTGTNAGGTTISTTTATTTTSSTTGTTTGSTGNPAEQAALSAQTQPFVNFQPQVIAQVMTIPNGTVTVSGLPTGAPGIVTPGAVAALTTSTDSAGNVTLTPIPGAAPSINPTGGGYQLVPQPITVSGQTLFARQVFLDALPGVTVHVDLLYTTEQ